MPDGVLSVCNSVVKRNTGCLYARTHRVRQPIEEALTIMWNESHDGVTGTVMRLVKGPNLVESLGKLLQRTPGHDLWGQKFTLSL